LPVPLRSRIEIANRGGGYRDPGSAVLGPSNSREAAMGSVMAIAAIMAFVGFMGGIVVGILLVVSVASRREDQRP
jgi:hypothetical protein